MYEARASRRGREGGGGGIGLEVEYHWEKMHKKPVTDEQEAFTMREIC